MIACYSSYDIFGVTALRFMMENHIIGLFVLSNPTFRSLWRMIVTNSCWIYFYILKVKKCKEEKNLKHHEKTLIWLLRNNKICYGSQSSIKKNTKPLLNLLTIIIWCEQWDFPAWPVILSIFIIQPPTHPHRRMCNVLHE